MWNARLDEAQAGIKIPRRNINNLRYADDTTLVKESKEEPKSLLMKVKEESEKPGLKLNIQKMKIMTSGPITSWQINGKPMETVTDFIFLGSKITADGNCSHEIIIIFSFIFISWRLITLQYCSGFCHTLTWFSHGFTSLPNPSGSSRCTSPEHLSHASNLGWWSVSPLIIYMFRCCSLEISHPRLLPQSPKVFCTSVSLFLFCI